MKISDPKARAISTAVDKKDGRFAREILSRITLPLSLSLFLFLFFARSFLTRARTFRVNDSKIVSIPRDEVT